MKELADENNKQVVLDTNEQWWKQAEEMKKNGFYVDFLKKNKDWTGPHICSKRLYNKGKKITLEFIEKIKIVEEQIKNPEMFKLYEEIKNKNA